MQSFLDMAIPGLRCLNPGCQAEAPMGNRITFRQILYKGWTCGYCGWEYIGALMDLERDRSIFLSDRAETEAVVADIKAEGGGASTEGQRDDENEAEQPKLLDDMDRAELVDMLEDYGLKLEDVPFQSRAVSNADIRAFITMHRDVASLGAELDAKRNQEQSDA